jgi:ABC-2 type transport system ATP-binding protein
VRSGGYPLPVQQTPAAQGSGLIALTPDAGSSGVLIAATPSPLGLHLPVTKPATGSQIVGPPKLTISYSGQGTSSSAPVYAQLVDKKRNLVVGNMVTPLRLVLDNLPHTATFSLEEVAASVQADSSYELQIIPGTSVYGPQRVAGLVSATSISLTLPVTSP